MGTNKIDRTKLIPNVRQRRQAACKSRRFLIQKTADLFTVCGKTVHLQLYDEKSNTLREFINDLPPTKVPGRKPKLYINKKSSD